MVESSARVCCRKNQGSRTVFPVAGLVWFLASLTVFVYGPESASQQASAARQASDNRADYYRQAFAALGSLPESDLEAIGSAVNVDVLSLYAPPSSWSEKDVVSFSDYDFNSSIAQEISSRLEPTLRLFWQGAEASVCDWEFDFASGNLGTQIPHLPLVTDLVRSVLFRAQCNWATRKHADAAADLQLLKVFAVDVGAEGNAGLISLAVQFNIERVVIYTVTRWLVDADSARTLEPISGEPLRPSENLAKKGLLLETKTVLPLARRLIDTSQLTEEQRRERYAAYLFEGGMTIGQLTRRYSEDRLLDQIGASEGHYHKVGNLLDLPVDRFQPRFDKYMSTLAREHNFFSDVGLVQCPGIERVYYDVKELHARWTMLQAAMDIAQNGVETLENHPDPFGRGRFEYALSGGGFTLRSGLTVNGIPVQVTFDIRLPVHQ